MRAVFSVFAFLFLSDLPVSAQTTDATRPGFDTILRPGLTVWITDSSGREERMHIVGVSGDVVTADTTGGVRRLRPTDISRIRARESDSLINGGVIGAGAAVASGLFLCTRTEPWDNCRDDVGPMLRIGAIGAGIGIGIDALIRGRRTIYEGGAGSTRLLAMPIVSPERRGLELSVEF